MRACRDGGREIEGALRTLDRSYFAVLYRECIRAVRSADAARELVQDTFIKVWQRCATFRGDSELLPWIRVIMRHAILDQLRRPLREVSMEEMQVGDLDARIEELSVGQLTRPDDELRRKQLAECFDRCWQRFTQAAPDHAQVVAWIADDGLSHEQIGELLDRTPGATREYISQCRKRARLYLAEWYALAFSET